MTEQTDLGLTDPALRARAVEAARGRAPFDRLIAGGTVMDMATGERRVADVGLVGPLIASVHPTDSRTDADEVIDAAGGFVAPGLIDTHMHVESSMVTPSGYAAAMVPRGVTTAVWDPHEFGNVLGLIGVRWAIEASRGLPLRFLVLAPSCVPSAPGLELSGAEFGGPEMAEMLAWPEIAGVAEVMDMAGVLDGSPRARAIVAAGLASGKLVCGHGRGLDGGDLQGFAAAGIGSDHELTSGADLLEKLRAGYAIELRGSHPHLLPEFAEALQSLGHMPQTVTLCTDDVFPDDLERDGGLDAVLRRLVGHGLPADWVLQAATLNAARRLGRSDLGLIAPGRRADIAVFDDLTSFRARQVLASGVPVAEAGRLRTAPREAPTTPLRGTMHLAPLSPADFRMPAEGGTVRVATIDRPRFTRWGEAEARVESGFVVPPEGTALMAVVHRHGRSAPVVRLAYLTGWGTWRGAFATTVSHDSHNLTIFGATPEDMAAAANAVIAAGGGLAVTQSGETTVLPLPLAGLVSEAPLAEIARSFEEVRGAMDRVADWQPPYRVFKACFGATLACNAGPHLTDLGVADAQSGQLLTTPVLGPAGGTDGAA